MKFKFGVLLVLVSLFGCSQDDSVVENEDIGVLLKKTITTNAIGSIQIEEYFYNGNKLIKTINSNQTYTEYTYLGNLIVKKVIFQDSGEAIIGYFFEYNSNNDPIVVKTLNYYSDTASKYVLESNANGRLSFDIYNGNLIEQNNYYGNKIYYFYDQEVVSGHLTWTNSSQIQTLNYSYNYDQGNSPMKNVAGYNKIRFLTGFFGSNHNWIGCNSTNSNGNTHSSQNVIEYNQENYPELITLNHDNSFQNSIQLFYE